MAIGYKKILIFLCTLGPFLPNSAFAEDGPHLPQNAFPPGIAKQGVVASFTEKWKCNQVSILERGQPSAVDDRGFNGPNNDKPSISEPAVTLENPVVFGDKAEKAYGLDAFTGQPKWKNLLIGQSIRERWPVVIKTSSATKAVFSTLLDENVAGALSKGMTFLLFFSLEY